MKQIYYVIQMLLHGRGSYAVKIVSLGLGLTMSILLFARVVYEQSFDTCFKENDKLYQLWNIWTVNGETYPPVEYILGAAAGGILDAMADVVESAASTGQWPVASPLYNGSVRFDDFKVAADSLFFRTMGIEVLSGDPVRELQQRDVVFLSKRLADKMFGGENPIGKVISYNKEIELTVKGTYATLPDNCTMRPEAVISLPSIWSRNIANYSWRGGDSWKEYIRLKRDMDLDELNKRIDVVVQRHIPKDEKFGISVVAKPIRDTYRGYDDVKRMRNIMLILGISILFITGLNYVLISISSLSRRAKSIGVHKCSGAESGTVLGMFMWETGIIILLSLLLMLFLLFNFREFVEDTTAARLESLFAVERMWVPLCVTAVLFLVGGVLPGQVFAKIPVTQVFRRYTEGKKGWKRPLLFIQFAGVAFISGLMCVVMLQYHYVIHKDSGYNPERVAIGYNNAPDKEAGQAARRFYESLPYVEALTSATSCPSDGYSGEMIPDEKGNNLFSSCYDYTQENYLRFMGMPLLQGRVPRESGEVAVNEELVRRMHWGEDVLGRQIGTEEGRVKIVGVIKDFNIEGFYEESKPFVLHHHPWELAGLVYVRLKEPFGENLQKLNRDAAEAFPDQSVEFVSLQQKMANDYNAVRVFRNAVLLAAVVVLFITLMGLIGYTNDELQRRSKEIAIRKVNGAESSAILEMLVRDVLWISLPAVLAGTVGACYVGSLWIEQFAVTVGSLTPYYICVAFVVMALIVGCVVWKTWRIANENPVKSIKSE
ncbi:FtsX-like permease family protein [Phocaeicola sp.]|uniref:ABC transporter permease n=1 Tax=Phocaeicola sp. TaxID=2773926 RepID=UPI0023D628D3|nr:FtsX-like permease family protein [Phocaeicola sp.]MDE5676763.1 ABC transporter permease [Phocaeicola sp.]